MIGYDVGERFLFVAHVGSDARLVKALKKRGVSAKLIKDARREATA